VDLHLALKGKRVVVDQRVGSVIGLVAILVEGAESAEYAWYETAFMVSPLIARRGRQDPFTLAPGEEAAKALWMGMAEYQVAWPFTRLSLDEVEDFIDRWTGCFADAAAARLTHPTTMPERQAHGSWRNR